MAAGTVVGWISGGVLSLDGHYKHWVRGECRSGHSLGGSVHRRLRSYGIRGYRRTAAFETTDVTGAALEVQAAIMFATMTASVAAFVAAALPLVTSFSIVFGGLAIAIYGAVSAFAEFVSPLGQLGGLLMGCISR